MSDQREYGKSFADERRDFVMMSILAIVFAVIFTLCALPFLSRTPMGLPRLIGAVADYSPASLARKDFEVTLDEDSFAAELDANGTLRLGKRDSKGKVRQVIPGGWSWQQRGPSTDTSLCLGDRDASAGAHCYTLSVSSGELFRHDGTRFGRILYVQEPKAPPRASQELHDIIGR